MSRVLVIGCGGVASVAIQKCCQADEVFTELCIASRTKEKCDALVEKLKGKTKTVLTTAKVDADDVDQLIELINDYKPDLVMNIALPRIYLFIEVPFSRNATTLRICFSAFFLAL